MLIPILVTVAVMIILFLIVVAMRATDFRTERSATISAPASAIFPQVNDFHNWINWSPYDHRDQNIKRTYSGAPAGPGAVYAWSGNNQVGEGSSTIIESLPNELVKTKLVFIRPFAGENTAEFTFKPQGPGGNQTLVTWALIGRNKFMMKAICLFMNMDKMIGGDFEKGLAKLKSVVETGAGVPADSMA